MPQNGVSGPPQLTFSRNVFPYPKSIFSPFFPIISATTVLSSLLLYTTIFFFANKKIDTTLHMATMYTPNPCKLYKVLQDDTFSQERDRVAARNTDVWNEMDAPALFAASLEADDETLALAPPTLIATHSIKGARIPVHVIENGFTSAECKHVIASAEAVGFKTRPDAGVQPDLMYKQAREYQDTASLAPVVSTAQIIFVRDEKLAGLIWSRIKRQLLIDNLSVSCIQNYDAGGLCKCLEGGGHYIPVGVNPLVRILKYEPGQVFSPHSDTSYRFPKLNGVPGSYRNGVSVVVYLNSQEGLGGQEDFTGGSLNFLQRAKVEVVPGKKPVVTYPHHDPPVTVLPKQGRIAAFDPNEKHESAKILSGVKYAIQTDVMFVWCPGSATA